MSTTALPKKAAALSKAVGSVAELQGLYGPFTFPEKLLQKIWLRGDFDRAQAFLQDGRRLTIKSPGRWNLLGGPDFKGARLKFGESPEIVGDVELHLRASDWSAHRHADDPAYDDVVLHVVLFPVAPEQVTIGAGAKPIPAIALLPLLHHDLEEYAADEAVETLANRPAAQIIEILGPLAPAALAEIIARHAAARWQQKVRFARIRMDRLGWTEACHQTALEILGYRFNRSTMLRIAAAHPLQLWSSGELKVADVFESERPEWSLQGLRPANHPRQRLNQYANWVRAVPDWPGQLERCAAQIPIIAAEGVTGDLRRQYGFPSVRAEFAKSICGGAIGGTRFANLMCDGFLPLLAARSGLNLRAWWYHWFAGDLPPVLPSALRQLQIFSGRANPACHGAAQGLLGWLIETERSALGPQGRGA